MRKVENLILTLHDHLLDCRMALDAVKPKYIMYRGTPMFNNYILKNDEIMKG